MMKIKKRNRSQGSPAHDFLLLLLILFLGLVSIGATAQDSVSLDDVLTQVRSKSYQMDIAEKRYELAETQLNLQKAELKPFVGLNMLLPNFINTSTQVVQPDGNISFQQVTQNNSSLSLYVNQNIAATGGQVFLQSDLQRFDDFIGGEKQYNGVPVRVGFIQPLFAFNRYKWNKKIVPKRIEEAKLELSTSSRDAQWKATVLFFDVLLAQVNREIAETNKKVNENLLEITKERYVLGKVSKNELLQLEMEVKLAQLSENQSLNEIKKTKSSLEVFLGGKSFLTEGEYNVPIVISDFKVELPALIMAAKKNRPEIIRYERELLENDRDVAKIKSQYGVKADLFAGFGYARAAEQLETIYTNPIDEQQVRFSLSLPIYDWGQKKEAVKLVQIQKDITKRSSVQEELKLENEVRMSVTQLIQAKEDIALLEEIKAIAKLRFEISNERYILGNISITELTLAQREKDQTKRNYIFALRSYWTSYYELKMLTGTEF